jgi:putative membrane protein
VNAYESGAPRDWTRSHIVTPFINAIQGLTVVVVATFAGVGQDQKGFGRQNTLTIILFACLVGGLVMVGTAYLAWRVNEYRIGDDAVYHRKGILFKQQRQARLDRLQAVDVVQPLLARVFGFAETRIAVAGGQGSTVSIKYLKVDDAESLRNEVLALAAGYRGALAQGAGSGLGAPVSQPEKQGPVAAAPERPVYAVPLGRLVGSILM